jgi:hypothetical protein
MISFHLTVKGDLCEGIKMNDTNKESIEPEEHSSNKSSGLLCPTCENELIKQTIIGRDTLYCEECEDHYNTSYLFGYQRGLKKGKNMYCQGRA